MLPLRGFNSIHFLYVVRQDYARYGALGKGDPHGPVYQLPDLCRICRHVDVMMGNILEEGNQVHLLLIIGAKSGCCLLSYYSHHRLVVHLRVIQAVQQVNGSWT